MALLLLAVGLAFLPENTDPAPGSPPASAGAKVRQRGAVSGTVAQRVERLRLLWRSAAGGKADPQQLELAQELIQSLPASALKELLVEFAPDPDGIPDLLATMARRIGDLEAERGLKWLVAEAATTEGVFESLFQPALDGWSDSDPVGLLGAFFDDNKSLEYRIRLRENSTWGDDGIAPDIVVKAAERDPDEVWRLLAKWQRSSLGDDFFKGLDPSLAQHFAGRIKDLFEDSERPGFQHLGGTWESWEGEQQVRRSAATAWFSLDQDKALAWFAPSDPPDSVEQGIAAGALSSRFYLTQPERAMNWLEAKPPRFRAAVAAELSYDLVASADLPESRLNDLTLLTGWMEEGQSRRRWLLGLFGALVERQQAHRLPEVTAALAAQLDLTAEEQAILAAHRQ
ncbi:hypothetical protein OKA05_05065 [Luteolibacter arcticus]|uniref:DUF3106 domain-containing protein n=1 Tax=Luteolibacter arcticus TaxID=1581411 RepID=A0ABT3GE75_9BACT|nr:hypothetical protein [Luteolibacter arcticus]